MPDQFSVVFPVFALIGLGYVAVKTRLCPETGVTGIMAFVTNFAAPCLLMRAVLYVPLEKAFEPALLASFYLPVTALFFLGFGSSRLIWKQRPGESVAIAFGASFGNTLMLGVPVVIGAFGENAMGPLIGLVGLHAVTMYLLGITMMESLGQEGAGLLVGLKRTLRAVATNSLLIGVALGTAGSLAGVAPLPAPIETPTKLLADAAIPLGLFGVGAALARYRLQGAFRIAWTSATYKLLLQPALTLAFGLWVFRIDPAVVAIATVVAAMPMGMNSYIFATFYSRAEAPAATGVVLTTLLAIVTIPLWLLLVTRLM